ncbi:MAG: hypothetical protein Q9182_006878 [Xanthomendoza sp. 2 TL-2023]
MVSSSSTSTDPGEVWRQLERNHFHNNDDRGEKIGTIPNDQAKWIINNKRRSIIEDEELGDVKAVLKEHGTPDKSTFLFHLCEALLRKDREKRVGLTDEEWLKTAWAKDGLKVNSKEPFYTASVPQLGANGEEWLAMLYENVPKVSPPCPDITYGHAVGMRLHQANQFGAILSKEVLLPWLFDATKSAGQPFTAAL